VAALSKAWVSGRLVTRVAGSNPAAGMDVCLLCLYVVLSCVGRGLCDGLITRPEESYRVSNCVCVIKNTQYRGGQGLKGAVAPWGGGGCSSGFNASYTLMLFCRETVSFFILSV
jgi:hypothetical protein